jgi:hypothetical protein
MRIQALLVTTVLLGGAWHASASSGIAAERASVGKAQIVDELSAAKRKKRVRTAAPRAAAPLTGPIACMRGGCRAIPRGCHIEPERTWDGSPTGFEYPVCP